MTRDDLAKALTNGNVQAFLRMLRYGEGTTKEDGYRTMFGGKLFDNNFSDHPKRPITKTLGGVPITSTAAGAYQFLSRTWAGLVKAYGFPDFSPTCQDQGAVALIAGRGALADVIEGRLQVAITKCGKEWASLPGSPYGQPTVTMTKARELYIAAGGRFEVGMAKPEPVPVPEVPEAPPIYIPIADMPPPPEPSKPKEKTVPPFLLAALPSLFDAVPKLISLFGDHSEAQEKNVKAIQLVADIAKTATGAVNEQELISKLQNDPAAAVQVKQAVEQRWFELSEVGGGIEAARRADAVAVASGENAWKSPSFLMAVALLPLIYLIIGAVVGFWGDPFSDDVRSAIANGVIGLVLGGLVGYYFGQVTSRNRPASATVTPPLG